MHSKFVRHSTEIIQQSKIRGPLPNLEDDEVLKYLFPQKIAPLLMLDYNDQK